MSERHCFCGATVFRIRQDDNPKAQITLICAGCRCERLITTPEVSAKRYEVSAPFAPEVTPQ